MRDFIFCFFLLLEYSNLEVHKSGNMTKRSRTNIEVSENHSKKRIRNQKYNRQHGGAAAAAADATTATTTANNSKTKQIYKGAALDELNKYLNLNGVEFNKNTGQYTFAVENKTPEEIESMLEPGIKQLQKAITALGENLSNRDGANANASPSIANIIKSFPFDENDDQLKLLENIEFINRSLEYLNTNQTIKDDIIGKLAKKPDGFTESATAILLEKLTQAFSKSNTFRDQVKALFNNADKIPFKLLALTKDAMTIVQWQQITNIGDDKSHVIRNNQVEKSAPPIDISNPEELNRINTYFKTCEELQVYYNKKHNEILDLYNIIKNIINLKLALINITLRILSIIQTNITRNGDKVIYKEYIPQDEDLGYLNVETDGENEENGSRPTHGGGQPPSITFKLPDEIATMKNILNNQALLLKTAKTLFENKTGAQNPKNANTGSAQSAADVEEQEGGGNAAAATPEFNKTAMVMSQLSENNEFTITNLDPNKQLKSGQNIMITILTDPPQQILARYTGDNKFTLLQPAGSKVDYISIFPNIMNRFNNATRIEQENMIDYIDYVIPDAKTMTIIGELKYITNVERTMMQRQQSLMTGEYAPIQKFTDTNELTDDLEREEIPFTQENTENNISEKQAKIQRVILNCYDLQNLYLIKHLEFINLFKMILYYADMFMTNVSVFYYVLMLYQVSKIGITYATKTESIEIPHDIKTNAKIIELLSDTGSIVVPPPKGVEEAEIGKIELEPTIANVIPAPFKFTVRLPARALKAMSKKLQEQANLMNKVIKHKSSQVGGAYETPTSSEPIAPQSKEREFDDKIQRFISGKAIIYNYANLHQLENRINDQLIIEYDDNLFKAWLLTRIERLNRLLDKNPNMDPAKTKKINNIIDEYQHTLEQDTNSAIDIAAYVNRYAEIISDDYVLDKIQKEITLLPEQITHKTEGTKEQKPEFETAKQTLLNLLKDQNLCTIGDKASCDTYYNESLAVIKYKLGTMGFSDENIIVVLGREVKDTFAINQIAMYLVQTEAKTFEEMRTLLQSPELESQEVVEGTSKTNMITILNRILNKEKELKETIDKNKYTVKQLKKDTNYNRYIQPIVSLMEAFKKGNIQQLMTQINLNPDLKEVFEKIRTIYGLLQAKKRMNDDSYAFLTDMENNNTDLVMDTVFSDYKTFILEQIEKLKQIKPEHFALLLQIIKGAARIVVGIKTIETENDNNVPIILSGEVDKYNLSNYFANGQKGGYNYSDIIQAEDGLKLKIGSYCSDLLPEGKKDYTYGPFSAVYPPQYNNFDKYANLFGTLTIQEIRNETPQSNPISPLGISQKLNRPLNGSRSFSSILNTNQELMTKLSSGGSVVLFGYGFSGSGKTYTLIEGSKTSVDSSGQQVKYDPSILEQFIKDNSEVIESIEFMELYPLGYGEKREKKIINSGMEQISGLQYNTYLGEIGDTTQEKKKNDTEEVDLYQTIALSQITGDKFQYIFTHIKLLERHRIHKLRILATPNNDNSSRSYLQITLNIAKSADSGANAGKLVFFDMPGTENTVRIKAEFMGSDIFSSIKGKYATGVKYYVDNNGNLTTKSTKTLHGQIIEDNKVAMKTAVDSFLVDSLLVNSWINPNGQGVKIYAVQRSPAEAAPKEKSKTSKTQKGDIPEEKELMIFKYNLGQLLTFSDYGLAIHTNVFGRVGREMAFFFNGMDYKTINETTDPIIFLDNNDHKLIFYTFMNFFNKKEKTDGVEKPLFFSPNTNGKCKFSQELDKNDVDNIFNIFQLKLNTNDTTPLEEIVAIFYTKTANSSARDPSRQSRISTRPEKKTIHTNTEIALGSKKLTEEKILYTLDDIMDFKTLKTPSKCTPQKSIFFYNPLIKYLYLIINFVYNTKFNNKARIDDAFKYDFYIICNFFIYQFIKFIVEQGRDIVTTLEHLKFFFLSRVDGAIDRYNAKSPDKAFLFGINEDALEKEKTYIIPVKYGIEKPISIQEKVNLGQFKTFQLLEILQKLAGNQSNLYRLEFKKLLDSSFGYPNLLTPSQEGQQADILNSIFVMFANIKAFIKDPETFKLTNQDPRLQKELPKLCTAEFDTLEFAENISSTTFNKNSNPSGGARKPIQHRKKYYISSRHGNKSTIKRSLLARNRSIYSRRSKKYTY
jgi:hypothetical protein